MVEFITSCSLNVSVDQCAYQRQTMTVRSTNKELFTNCYLHNALDKAPLLWFIMYRVMKWLRVPRWAYKAQVQYINDSVYLIPPSRFFEEILIHKIQDIFHFAGRNDLIASMADRAYHRWGNGIDCRRRHLQRATMRKCRAIKLELEGLCAAILAARIFFLRDTDCKVIEKSLNGSLTMYQEYMLDHLPRLLETKAPHSISQSSKSWSTTCWNFRVHHEIEHLIKSTMLVRNMRWESSKRYSKALSARIVW